MAGPWKSAIKKAIKIEAEGAKDFVEFSAESKKRKHVEIDITNGDNLEETELESDKISSSGYKQPALLASFVNKVAKLGTIQTSEIVQIQEETAISPNEPTTVGEIDSRQICRTWLKNHFLGLGTPCNKNPCPRQHEVVGNPDRLYSDYSFKGLPPRHQKAILTALKK